MSGHTPGLNNAQRSALAAIAVADLNDPETARQLKADLSAYENAMGLQSAISIEAKRSSDFWSAQHRLHDAAPCLLAALESAVDAYGKPGGPWNVPSDPGGWLDQARAAIAKAKGE